MSKQDQTSENDVAILREAHRVLEKYVRLSAVAVFGAMDEIDSIIDLIEKNTPLPQPDSSDSIENEESA